MLVETMAQSYRLRKRTLILQNTCFDNESPVCDEPKNLALYIRYQSTHDRAFHKGERRQAAEKRKQDVHEYAVLLAGANVDH